MFTIAKLMKILKPYIEENQLSYFDKNLFHSFYSAQALEEKPQSRLAVVSSIIKASFIGDTKTNIDIEDLKPRL